MSKQIDDSDLRKLQSIQLGFHALDGDDGNTSINPSYNYKNTLALKSAID